MNIEERHIVHVKDRSSIAVGFPISNMRNDDMGCYEADTWSQKDESYILRRHIVYDKTNDQILIAYPDFQKCWKMHYWSVPMERITSDRAAPYVWKKLGTRHWWSERVAAALRKAVEKVLTGDFDGLRVIEGEVGNYAYR